jgi:hypothetical protein
MGFSGLNVGIGSGKRIWEVWRIILRSPAFVRQGPDAVNQDTPAEGSS